MQLVLIKLCRQMLLDSGSLRLLQPQLEHQSLCANKHCRLLSIASIPRLQLVLLADTAGDEEEEFLDDDDDEGEPEDSSDSDYGSSRKKGKARKAPAAAKRPARTPAARSKPAAAAGSSRAASRKVRGCLGACVGSCGRCLAQQLTKGARQSGSTKVDWCMGRQQLQIKQHVQRCLQLPCGCHAASSAQYALSEQ
jgi:hypothetical protein